MSTRDSIRSAVTKSYIACEDGRTTDHRPPSIRNDRYFADSIYNFELHCEGAGRKEPETETLFRVPYRQK